MDLSLLKPSIEVIQMLLSNDPDGLESLKEIVISYAQVTDDNSVQDLLDLLQCFELVGLKKIPERLKVLKELKDRIESKNVVYKDLLDIMEAYPLRLKNKVSLQMS